MPGVKSAAACATVLASLFKAAIAAFKSMTACTFVVPPEFLKSSQVVPPKRHAFHAFSGQHSVNVPVPIATIIPFAAWKPMGH